jgi:hypothetical protein
MAYKNQKKNKAHSKDLRKDKRHFKIERKRERTIRELVNSGISRAFAQKIAR